MDEKDLFAFECHLYEMRFRSVRCESPRVVMAVLIRYIKDVCQKAENPEKAIEQVISSLREKDE